MSGNVYREKIEKLLVLADIQIDGSRPWDIQVHNEQLYSRAMSGGSLAFGQSYMDGWWDCEKLDEFFFRILKSRLEDMVNSWTWYFDALKAKWFNFQKPSRAYEIGRRHYDIGNDLFRLMLGQSMIYSCGYWETASTLDEAQEAKLELICRKLDLQPGMSLLDIGCGWGGAAKFAAEHYDVEVVGYTVSKEQVEFGKDLCRGLPVDLRLMDYRDIHGSFDRVLSVGMFEHVGYKNYSTFMNVVRTHLKEHGLFLLHTIGQHGATASPDAWMTRYIFPNSMLPQASQICSAIEDVFVLEDWHNFGADYYKTLIHWFKNFQDSWSVLEDRYDERFYRMWKYYLLSCAGSFRARKNQLWQLVLSPDGVPGGYRSPRYSKSAEPLVYV